MDRKERKKLEWKQTLVVVLALVTMVAMNSYIDWLNQAGPERGEAVADAAGSGAAVAAAVEAAGNHEGVIRFHVIANSDSRADQDLKLKVRNHVLSQVQNNLMDLISRRIGTGSRTLDLKAMKALTAGERAELTRGYINENMEEIEGWAEDVIQAEGFDYDVKASLGITWIPAKNYDGLFFPAGNYEALNIVIGEGDGQNWWCVIFPPLCLIDGGLEGGPGDEAYDEVRGETGAESYTDGFMTDMEGGSRVILKSKIMELLKSWQGES